MVDNSWGDTFDDVPEEVLEDLRKMSQERWRSECLLDPAPEERASVAGMPICTIPSSEKKYANFLGWWSEVGRSKPRDAQGWSTLSGPWVMRGRVDLILPEEWEALPDSERALIKEWTLCLPIGMFYD